MTLVGRHYLLTYRYPDDWQDRRLAHRDEHMELARAWHAEGRLVYAGVVGDPSVSALVVFAVDGPEQVEDFVAADPYVREGIVTDYTVEPWTLSQLG